MLHLVFFYSSFLKHWASIFMDALDQIHIPLYFRALRDWHFTIHLAITRCAISQANWCIKVYSFKWFYEKPSQPKTISHSTVDIIHIDIIALCKKQSFIDESNLQTIQIKSLYFFFYNDRTLPNCLHDFTGSGHTVSAEFQRTGASSTVGTG